MRRMLVLVVALATFSPAFAGCCVDPCDRISPGNPCLAETAPVDPCEHPCRNRWWNPLRARRCCVWSPVPDPCAPAWDLPDPCASDEATRAP